MDLLGEHPRKNTLVLRSGDANDVEVVDYLAEAGGVDVEEDPALFYFVLM